MRRSLVALAAGALLAGAAVAAPRGATGEAPTGPGPAAEQVKWELGRLNQEPFRLLKATPDAPRGQVRFLLEFTRPPTLAEQFDLERGGGPFVFRFVDEDGVVIKSVAPRLEGEVVPHKGARLRMVLTMPDARVLAATRAIIAE